jgi:hypothetical protein
MELSSVTSLTSTTKRRRLRWGESPFPKHFREMSLSCPSTSDRHPRIRKNPRGLPRVQQVRNPWMRTPRTRCSYSPYSRGMAQTKPRPWRQNRPHAEDWRAKYLAWIDRGELPSDRFKARCIVRKVKSFTVIELSKHAAPGVLQRCIPILHGRELIRDIHAGMCGHHAAPRTLVGNAFC